jgi:hypothetical protein
MHGMALMYGNNPGGRVLKNVNVEFGSATVETAFTITKAKKGGPLLHVRMWGTIDSGTPDSISTKDVMPIQHGYRYIDPKVRTAVAGWLNQLPSQAATVLPKKKKSVDSTRLRELAVRGE